MFCPVQLINFLSLALTNFVLSESLNSDPFEIVQILVNNVDVGRTLSNKDCDTKTPNSGKRTSKASKMF